MQGPQRTATRPDDPISVLLVDDDERWATYLSTQLQREEPTLTTTVALSPNEAFQQVRTGTEFDCVIAPHGTCGIDGLRLLERIREVHPDLPVLIVANRRSDELEEIVATDQTTTYLVTGPEAEPLALYAGKIVSIVDRYRLQTEFEELQQQYTGLTEQVDEAVAIIQDETLVYWNRTMSDMTGYDDSQLNTMYPVTELFHPAEREELRAVLTRLAGSRERQQHDTRLLTEHGEIRHCRLHARPTRHEGSDALLVTLTDQTEQRRRKRKLEWETELNRTLQQALLDAGTRQEMGERVCEQLCHYGYELAWTGEVADNTLEPQVVAGEDPENLSARTYETAGEDSATPGVWAARLREPQFINDLTDMLEAEWQQQALRAGYRSSGAVPLVYEDVFYGVLVVYHDQLKQFDETEQDLLCSLGNLLAFAIHDVETRQALSSNERVTLELRVQGREYYLNDLIREFESRSAECRVHGTAFHETNTTRQYVTVENLPIDSFEQSLQTHGAVEAVTPITKTAETGRFQVLVDQETPQAKLAAHGAIVNRSVVRIDGTEIGIELPNAIDTAETIDHLKESFDLSMESITETRSTQAGGQQYVPEEIESLTAKQAAALETAFHHGYFERPRKSDASEIATALDISHSTFLQHLRVAEQKLLQEFYE